ncbi:MAG: hypothetical protein A3J65_00015 [Candidatus Buchananbacteria bacterium RIFCSPHIGHO2_02_FULL_45_11b]|uniref:Uncharacterized protein n=3 Tax=Candidatus Buchananiibacteriota TaxID=1817903 RepID=A0A1G1Y517_9BACT|nr:MAG: hypothetical protein A2663_04140 [Candidatus Buchananbacteria bacterium RIFCSPHIGHO2_01_FULL_46_12]OGY50319.1 MAG: hypothetical protein A3J65_00015 [Candidatus Buchananbacteria bacterium RIFCSPHIGHO2_02_FULL_45_11b]OGY57451.1 MAG: hypothetical protein A3H67_02250 [Candidatus Buchananbacteria bacterium RIFCSPLOWO2_02_FULL_46_11b]
MKEKVKRILARELLPVAAATKDLADPIGFKPITGQSAGLLNPWWKNLDYRGNKPEELNLPRRGGRPRAARSSLPSSVVVK